MDILKLKNKMSKLKTSLEGLNNVTLKIEQSLRDLWETPKALMLMYHQSLRKREERPWSKKII